MYIQAVLGDFLPVTESRTSPGVLLFPYIQHKEVFDARVIFRD